MITTSRRRHHLQKLPDNIGIRITQHKPAEFARIRSFMKRRKRSFPFSLCSGFGLHRGVGGNSTNTLLPNQYISISDQCSRSHSLVPPTRGSTDFVWISSFVQNCRWPPCVSPIVPCGSLGCLFPLGGDLRVSKKVPPLAHLRYLLTGGLGMSTAYRRRHAA